jgi:hypothetical protein
VYVASNVDPVNGLLSGLVTFFIAIAGIAFVGHCTNEICEDSYWKDVNENSYFVAPWRSHNDDLK